MTDIKKRFTADKKGWPYAFGHWLAVVGLDTGRTLDSNDLYALNAYRTDWEREGVKTPIYYSRSRQDKWDAAATTSATADNAPDPAGQKDAARFLRCLFLPYERGFIELRCLRFAHNEAAAKGLYAPGSMNPKTGVRTWRGFFPLADTVNDPSELLKMAREATAATFDVYLGVLPRGTSTGQARKDTIYEAGALWAELDFDKQGGESATLKKAQAADPDMIVRSGGGVHCYWMMTTPIPLTDESRSRFENSLRSRQDNLGTDRTHDCTRILRLPGTKNFKQKEPRKVELVKCH